MFGSPIYRDSSWFSSRALLSEVIRTVLGAVNPRSWQSWQNLNFSSRSSHIWADKWYGRCKITPIFEADAIFSHARASATALAGTLNGRNPVTRCFWASITSSFTYCPFWDTGSACMTSKASQWREKRTPFHAYLAVSARMIRELAPGKTALINRFDGQSKRSYRELSLGSF